VSDADKVEFASPAWIAAAEEVLHKFLDGIDLGGRSFAISEEFTDPPAHLLRDGVTTVAWHFRVSDAGIEVGEGALDDADLCTRVDYQAVLPVARLVYGTSEEEIAEAMKLRDAARETGDRVGDESVLPPELMQRLFAVHNELARRTL
jgi:hypothetical protein